MPCARTLVNRIMYEKIVGAGKPTVRDPGRASPRVAGGPGAGKEMNNAMEENYMETTMNTIIPETLPGDEARPAGAAPRAKDRTPGRLPDDAVRWREFQLALWVGAFSLTAVLGGFVFLHTAITDLRVAMETQHAEMRVEMEAQHAAIRDELRSEMETQHAAIRSEMETQHAETRTEIINLRERVVRIETRLEVAAAPPNESAA